MKAIVLAAGKGERLKGTVDNIPKPMVKVKGKPILEYNILLLKKYGIFDIYINLHHYPDVIKEYFGNGEKLDVNIKYSYEETLLGTAGAVRKIADEYWSNPGCFIVLYGDNLFECDLNEIIDFHERKKGIATIAVYQKDDVSHSGIVLLDSDNKIIKFIEKPNPEECISHLVNTGFYILEPHVLNYIPPDRPLDFGKDMFPKMIQQGENIFGVIVKCNLTAVDTPKLLKEALQMKNIKNEVFDDNHKDTF